MNPIFRTPLSRRAVLRGVGATLALPFLEAMLPRLHAAPSTFRPLAKSGTTPTPRAIFCYVPNGVNILDWIPAGKGAGYELSPTLGALRDHRENFSVISGLGHPQATGGHSGADTWLTGADLRAVPGKDYTNTISIDQVIAEQIGAKTRLPSIEIGDMSGTGGALHSHTLAFDRNGTPLPAENNPQRLFERLFVPDDASSREATLRRYAEKRSVLDDVLGEAKSLEKKLGKSDQAKLGEYLAAVRETELRVQRQVDWIDVPKPAVNPAGLQLESQPGNAHDRPMWLDVMLEISYLAFLTDTTRVITFEWAREAGGYGPGGQNHHELSHHGGDEGMLKKLAEVDRGYLERLARFLSFLKETEEGGRPMLDHTMIVYGSGMNSGERGDHSPKNLPLIVAGGSAWGLKHGQHLAHDPEKHPPLSNVLLTVTQKMGVETDKFQDATGTLTGLA
ncbi:DUF1552 domain-containing protein [Luteolibacter arcticus]|uniref:DUF1552 domain-containing protein n=1 Tax=Luteolibacter arcticus TaxID=1581411 RepID=A0ABT3GND5_9BACT|nr:DUF1552 domain-containing protein [Luteolibacter arcticus]MCW1925024.1 DUF1552 domain-containing protein [Luteolibacter arcticus]